MWRKVLVAAVFVAIVGGSLAMSKQSDAEVLTRVGRSAAEQVAAALPERTAVAGPLAQVQVGDLTAVDDRVRLRLKTDVALQGAQLAVTADQGAVRLSGRVETAAQRERAVHLAQTTAGVTRVEQEIAVPEGR